MKAIAVLAFLSASVFGQVSYLIPDAYPGGPFLGLHVEVHSPTHFVVFAQFDSPQIVSNVFNANIPQPTLGWRHDDFNTNSWDPTLTNTFTPTAEDSYVCIGGGLGVGSYNSTSPDPNFGSYSAWTIPLNAGWYNNDPGNAQGSTNANHRTRIGSFAFHQSGETAGVNAANPNLLLAFADAAGNQSIGTATLQFHPSGGPPTAAFSMSASSGSAPFSVSFTDQSGGNPTSWFWNFGDGSGLSSAQNPTHVYTNPGTYTVTLTVINAVGANATSMPVTVTPPPWGMTINQAGNGSASLALTGGVPNARYWMLHTPEVLNSVSPGTGWAFGLHIPISEAALQMLAGNAGSELFGGVLDGAGTFSLSLPSAAVSFLAGQTWYSVGIQANPSASGLYEATSVHSITFQ